MKKYKLSLASTLFIIILILWPVLALFSLPAGSTYTAQLESIRNDSTLYIINFIVAFLIAPSILFMLFEFYKAISDNTWTIISKTALVLYAIYFVLISISYGSQFMYLPFILETYEKDEILKWYFFNDKSFALFFNQTGYLFWSIATLLIFTKYIFKSKIQFLAIKILTLSALTQIVATFGFYFDNSGLASLSFYSGILLLPAAITILIYSIKRK